MKKRCFYYNKINFQISNSEEAITEQGFKKRGKNLQRKDFNLDCRTLISLFGER